MAVIELRKISKYYHQTNPVLHDFDLTICDGEFLILVGPSGCGKSTTLRLIAGLEVLSGGSIYIDGLDVSQQEPGTRDIAMVFQSYALYPHMTVYDNMAYGLKNQRLDKVEIVHRIDEASEILELTSLLDRRPQQLSGGQRQRVAMGRALVRHPKAFLLDEPLSNLDARLRANMRGALKKLHGRLGTTFVYVTHDQGEAMSLADRIVVMNQGQIEQVGSPSEIYNRPATRFVAEFIGAPPMNIIPGNIIPGNIIPGNMIPGEETSRIIIPDVLADRHPSEIGFRPEVIKLHTGKNKKKEETNALIKMHGTIIWLDHLGADSYAYVRVLGYESEIAIRIDPGTHLTPGEEVIFSVAVKHCCLFDATGKRLEKEG